MEEKKYRILMILTAAAIFAAFLITRLYRLDIVPFGAHRMHIDELGAAYDAFCISDYGVDQFLYRMPVYFKCFGEGQNALYTYLAVIAFRIGGISIFTFRLPAVICAAGAFAALYFMLRDMLDRWYAVVGLALMTVMPVFMMSEHWGLEAYLLMSFVIISLCFQIRAVTKDSSLCYFLAGISWGLSLYTYSMAYVIVPLFLFFSFIALIVYKKLSLKNALLAGIPLVLLGLPLFVQQLVMMEAIQPFSFMGLVDFWSTSHYRADEISIANVPENLIMSFKYTYVADRSAYDANAKWGTMYYITIPFILVGIIASARDVIKNVRAKVLDPWMFVWMFFIVSRIFLLFVKYPNINRINGIFPAYLLFAVYGIRTVAEKINKKVLFYSVLSVIYLVCFLTFSRYFYSHDGLQADAYDIGDSLGCDLEAGEAAALAKQIAMGRPVCAMLNDGWMRHLSIAMYTETSPYKFNRDHEPQDRDFNGVKWYMPEELDLSGNTVYLIDNELNHIISYLVSEEGFMVDVSYPDFTVVFK